MKGRDNIKIVDTNKEIYLKNIEKYMNKIKKYQDLSKISRFLYFIDCISLFSFYGFLFVYLFMHFLNRETRAIFYLMINIIIIGIISSIVLIICELNNFKLSWKEKIYYKINTNIKNGFHFDDITFWYEGDKVKGYLVFSNDKTIINDFVKLDEFDIVFDDILEPEINFDNSIITFPNCRKDVLNCVFDNESLL